MQRKILIAIFAILLLGIMVILANLLSVKVNDDVANTPIIKNVMQAAKKVASSQDWTSKLAGIEQTEHYLPVNELYIQIDLQRQNKIKKTKILPKEQKKQINKIIIDRADRYSLYCIKQTINSFSLPYNVIKEKENAFVFIQNENENKIQDIVKKLKELGVKSTVKKVWL